MKKPKLRRPKEKIVWRMRIVFITLLRSWNAFFYFRDSMTVYLICKLLFSPFFFSSLYFFINIFIWKFLLHGNEIFFCKSLTLSMICYWFLVIKTSFSEQNLSNRLIIRHIFFINTRQALIYMVVLISIWPVFWVS